MPLLDHFNPPLYPLRHWESFHGRWAAAIGDALNEKLPPRGYFAEMQVHVGSRAEVDVGTFEGSSNRVTAHARPVEEGGVATVEAPVGAPPKPAISMPATFPDSFEVLVYNGESGATLVAAVELVSPGNKDPRDAARLRRQIRNLTAARGRFDRRRRRDYSAGESTQRTC